MNLMTKQELFENFYFESHELIETNVVHAISVPLKPNTVTIIANVNFAYKANVKSTPVQYHEGKLCVVTDNVGDPKFVVIPLLA